MGGRLGKNCERLQREICMEMGQDKKQKIMGTEQSKEISKASLLRCIIAHWERCCWTWGHSKQKRPYQILQGLVAFI